MAHHEGDLDADDELDDARSGSDEPPLDADASDAGEPLEVREFIHRGPVQRLDQFLASNLPGRSRSYLKRLIESGYVDLFPPGDRQIKPSLPVRDGVRVELHIPPPLKVTLAPEPIPLEILYQDEHLAVINKQAGLTVHPAPHQPTGTLVNALLYWLDDLSGIAGVERPGIVHRLDKETSGVLLVAKNDVAHQSLARQFKERHVHKTYLAITRGKPRQWEGRIDLPLGRQLNHSIKITTFPPGTTRGRPSITDYRVLETFEGFALVECYPQTGRTHQIRVHLRSQGLPIACDKLYGREKAVWLSSLRNQPRPVDEPPILARHALHAAGISFQHPVTLEEVQFQAPLPEDLLDTLHALQTHRSPR